MPLRKSVLISGLAKRYRWWASLAAVNPLPGGRCCAWSNRRAAKLSLTVSESIPCHPANFRHYAGIFSLFFRTLTLRWAHVRPWVIRLSNRCVYTVYCQVKTRLHALLGCWSAWACYLNMPGVTRMSFPAVSGRICIARALALNPKVIIADEAVSALDVSIRGQIINLLLDLQRDFGIAYLFISHDMAVVARISHRVAVMYLGQIVEIGPRRAVFENPQHPYTRKLLAAVPVAEPSRQRPQRVLLSDDLPSNIHLRGEEVAAVSLQCVGPGHYVAQPQSEYAFMRR